MRAGNRCARPAHDAVSSIVRQVCATAGSNHIAEAVEPEARFRDVLSHAWWCVQCFGVMRRDAFLRTSGHGNYWGADKVFLAELALAGPLLPSP